MIWEPGPGCGVRRSSSRPVIRLKSTIANANPWPSSARSCRTCSARCNAITQSRLKREGALPGVTGKSTPCSTSARKSAAPTPDNCATCSMDSVAAPLTRSLFACKGGRMPEDACFMYLTVSAHCGPVRATAYKRGHIAIRGVDQTLESRPSANTAGPRLSCSCRHSFP